MSDAMGELWQYLQRQTSQPSSRYMTVCFIVTLLHFNLQFLWLIETLCVILRSPMHAAGAEE